VGLTGRCPSPVCYSYNIVTCLADCMHHLRCEPAVRLGAGRYEKTRWEALTGSALFNKNHATRASSVSDSRRVDTYVPALRMSCQHSNAKEPTSKTRKPPAS
jgi:hypothetical protein